jgi:hypothetical protein
MSANWAERERATNYLVRAVAKFLLDSKQLAPESMYGLGKLTWITNSYEGDNPAYISSTKIPALGAALGIDFGNKSLAQVAGQCARVMGAQDVDQLVLRHTGFTNFYKAYRNSVRDWIDDNHATLINLYSLSYRAAGIDDRRQLIEMLGELPGIPKANNPKQRMRAEYYVTPILFSLDPNLQFPLINGNEWVQNVLAALNVTGASLSDQFEAMNGMLGQAGVEDAADLDQVGRVMGKQTIDLIQTQAKARTKALLGKKQTTGEKTLPLKDEADIQVIQRAGSKLQRRKHNELTNSLQTALGEFTLVEGTGQDCMFDVLVKDYDGEKNDLLIEAKSSAESANIRMAVGQLFHYWFGLGNSLAEAHLALLVPERPTDEILRFLEELEIGALWFEGGRLVTENDWLEHLSSES